MTSNLTSARRRRLTFIGFGLPWLGWGAALMAGRLSEDGWTATEGILFTLFLLLLAQVVYGFTVAVAGWWLLWQGGDPARINNTLPPEAVPGDLPPVAVVMPICNEDVGRVFDGLQAMYESLQSTGASDAFNFFILSDTGDPNIWMEEEKAWFELCRRVQGFGRVFYRKRRIALHHKSGNIADFCRRWAAKYRYMIVLDADSIMTGRAMIRLACLMERNPRAGIIQTAPKLALGRSLFQRISQFASHLYGPMFAAGANFWQLDSSNFWGHNAILRLKPFTEHCALPGLPGSGPLGTRILSHDTVEAAFMRRAGYEVWLAYDVEGSYEETPPNLLASLRRDRRWCHGNLQHIWFLFARGLKAASRINILLGIMTYVGSPLWLLFLLADFFLHINGGAGANWHGYGAGNGPLFAGVLCLLLAPKALGTSLIARSPEKVKAWGGRARLLFGAIAETMFSMMLAPVLMLFHTQFVLSSLSGVAIGWSSQERAGDRGPSWRALASAHGPHTGLALGWAGLVAWLAPSLLPWAMLILVGPILAIPICRFTASAAPGLRARKRGWFVVPEETDPPRELGRVLESGAAPADPLFRGAAHAPDRGLLQVILDPYANAIHRFLLRERPLAAIRTREYMAALADRLLLEGPFALTFREKRALLWDGDSMLRLHRKLWSSPATHLHEWWQAAMQRYHWFREQDSRRQIGAL